MRTTTLGVMLVSILGSQTANAQEAATFGEGAQVYAATCGRCHNARGPSERTDREWGVIMLHMRIRGVLSGRETRAVLLFLQTTNVPPTGTSATTSAGGNHDIAASVTQRQVDLALQAPPISGPAVLTPDLGLAAGPDSATVGRGEKLVEANGCMACHKVGKFTAGKLGPDLNTVFERRKEEWILKKLADPKTDNAATVMPQMNLKEVDRESIVLYLRSIAKR